jgi:Fe-Mn family superoxide dismutase
MKTVLSLLVFALLSTGVCAEEAESPLLFDNLPYAYDALEPYIDARTMEIHYSRHHKGYFDGLLKAVANTPLSAKPIEEILANVSSYPDALRNNAGGHYNHSLFWRLMSPGEGVLREGPLADAIQSRFGSFAEFQAQFKQAALSRFGSGWAWLCVKEDGTLSIMSTPNQDNPLMDTMNERATPILLLDIWEHAYYLKYQNMRAHYIDAFWNVVNWGEVERLYNAARGGAID